MSHRVSMARLRELRPGDELTLRTEDNRLHCEFVSVDDDSFTVRYGGRDHVHNAADYGLRHYPDGSHNKANWIEER